MSSFVENDTNKRLLSDICKHFALRDTDENPNDKHILFPIIQYVSSKDGEYYKKIFFNFLVAQLKTYECFFLFKNIEQDKEGLHRILQVFVLLKRLNELIKKNEKCTRFPFFFKKILFLFLFHNWNYLGQNNRSNTSQKKKKFHENANIPNSRYTQNETFDSSSQIFTESDRNILTRTNRINKNNLTELKVSNLYKKGKVGQENIMALAVKKRNRKNTQTKNVIRKMEKSAIDKNLKKNMSSAITKKIKNNTNLDWKKINLVGNEYTLLVIHYIIEICRYLHIFYKTRLLFNENENRHDRNSIHVTVEQRKIKRNEMYKLSLCTNIFCVIFFFKANCGSVILRKSAYFKYSNLDYVKLVKWCLLFFYNNKHKCISCTYESTTTGRRSLVDIAGSNYLDLLSKENQKNETKQKQEQLKEQKHNALVKLQNEVNEETQITQLGNRNGGNGDIKDLEQKRKFNGRLKEKFKKLKNIIRRRKKKKKKNENKSTEEMNIQWNKKNHMHNKLNKKNVLRRTNYFYGNKRNIFVTRDFNEQCQNNVNEYDKSNKTINENSEEIINNKGNKKTEENEEQKKKDNENEKGDSSGEGGEKKRIIQGVNKMLKKLSLMSFNTGLLEYKIFGFCIYQNPPFIINRLLHIPSALKNTKADIIALQEVYDEKHVEFLKNNLKSEYPFCARDNYCSETFKLKFLEQNIFNSVKANCDNTHSNTTNYSASYGSNNATNSNTNRSVNSVGNTFRRKKYLALHHGLLVFSKYPIIYSYFHNFKHVTYLENLFGTKGFLEVIIDIPSFSYITLINMHLASGAVDTESKYMEKVRDFEIKQIIEIAKEAKKRKTIPIIIGDLNAAPNLCPNNYSSFIKRGWKDAWLYARNIKKMKRKQNKKDLLHKEMIKEMKKKNCTQTGKIEQGRDNSDVNICNSSHDLFKYSNDHYKAENDVFMSQYPFKKSKGTKMYRSEENNWIKINDSKKEKKKEKKKKGTFYTDTVTLFSENMEKKEYSHWSDIEETKTAEQKIDTASISENRKKCDNKIKDIEITNSETNREQNEKRNETTGGNSSDDKYKMNHACQLKETLDKDTKQTYLQNINCNINKKKQKYVKTKKSFHSLFHASNTCKINRKLTNNKKVSKQKKCFGKVVKTRDVHKTLSMHINEKKSKKYVDDVFFNIKTDLVNTSASFNGSRISERNWKTKKRKMSSSFLMKSSVKEDSSRESVLNDYTTEKKSNVTKLNTWNLNQIKHLDALNHVDYTDNEINYRESLFKRIDEDKNNYNNKNNSKNAGAQSCSHSSDFTSENYFSLTDLYDDTSDSSVKGSEDEMYDSYEPENCNISSPYDEQIKGSFELHQKEANAGETIIQRYNTNCSDYICRDVDKVKRRDARFALTTSNNCVVHTKMPVTNETKREYACPIHAQNLQEYSNSQEGIKNVINNTTDIHTDSNHVCKNANRKQNNDNANHALVDRIHFSDNEVTIEKRNDSMEAVSCCEGTKNSTTIESLINHVSRVRENKSNQSETVIISKNSNNVKHKHRADSFLTFLFKKKKDHNETRIDEIQCSEKNVNLLENAIRKELKMKVNFTKKLLYLKNIIFKSVINSCDMCKCTDETNAEYINIAEIKNKKNGRKRQKKEEKEEKTNGVELTAHEKNEKHVASDHSNQKYFANNEYNSDSKEIRKQKTSFFAYNMKCTKTGNVNKNKIENVHRSNKKNFFWWAVSKRNSENKKKKNMDTLYLDCQKCSCNNSIKKNSLCKKALYDYNCERHNMDLNEKKGLSKDTLFRKRWKRKNNKKEQKQKEQLDKLNLLYEKTINSSKKKAFLKNTVIGKLKNKNLGDSDFTWDPQNPLNIIGPHAKCHGLRCDYIFFPPINFKEIKSKKIKKMEKTNIKSKENALQNISYEDDVNNHIVSDIDHENNDSDKTGKRRKKKKKKKNYSNDEQKAHGNNSDFSNTKLKHQENKISSDESINVKNHNLKILKHYYIKSAKILFNEPRVMVDTYKRLNNCCYSLCMKINHVSFVTMSDHYAVKVDLRLKKNIKTNNFEKNKGKFID